MVRIRPAELADAAAVEGIWGAVAAEGEWIGAEFPLDPEWRTRFLASFDSPDATCFVAEVEATVVGAVVVQAARGVAHFGMAILAGHRGVGLGRQLVNAAVSWSGDRGCHKVGLEVWPHNTRARRLYESVGFVDEGVLRRHYRRRNGALWDAVVMGLLLDTDSPGRP